MGVQEEGVPGAGSGGGLDRGALGGLCLGTRMATREALEIFGVLWYSKCCPPHSLWFSEHPRFF